MKEAEEKMKKMQEAMKRKYSCDRSITVTRLEDLLQDAAVTSNTEETFCLLLNVFLHGDSDDSIGCAG